MISNDPQIHRQIAFVQNAEGSALSPFDSWLLLRGVKTLALRVERQSSSALKIADLLAAHPQVREVYYPSLKNYRGHDVHQQQSSGGGSVISFTTGDFERSRRIVEATDLCSIAVSFGSVNSSISLPYYMSHASIPANIKEAKAPPSDLIRLSVGIEDVEDIIEDLTYALEASANESLRFQASTAVTI